MSRDRSVEPDRMIRSKKYRIFFILIAAFMVTSVFLVPLVAAGKPATGGGGKCKTEICDGRDNDCDKLIDENCAKYCDIDGDGYRGKTSSGTCTGNGCWVGGCSYSAGNDCNDSNSAISPGAIENCDSVDNDCDGYVDETCIDPSTCAELFPGTNDATADRINVVFAGMLFTDKNRFISIAQNAVDCNSNLPGTGLLELPVYRDNKDKFNFWYIDKVLTPSSSTITSCTQCSSSETSLYCTGLANKYVVNFCDVDFRGCAYFGGPSYIATYGSYGSNVPYVFDHEFQHQFPQLYDEYTESGLGDRPGSPNCAPDLATAQSWWGDLAGQTGSDGMTIGYYDGCSYVSGNYRSVTDSIMRSWRFNLGLVNERHVASDLSGYSGTSSGSPANAVEVVMSGNPADPDSYTVKDIRPVLFKNPVKVPTNNVDTLEIKVKDTVHSQVFITYRDLVTEDFRKGSSISLVDFRKVPQPVLTITVPTGDAVYNKATKKFDIGMEKGVPFTVSVIKHDGKGKTVYSSI